MYESIGDIATALNERGLSISRSTLNLYSDPHTLWFRRGQFNISAYRQMDRFARMNGMEEIMPPADMVRGFMNPSALTSEQRCEAELILSETAMRLAMEASGRETLPGYEEMSKARVAEAARTQDLARPFLEALRAGKVGTWLETLAPQRDDYRQMTTIYAGMQDPTERQMARATLAYMRREPTLPDENIIRVNLASQEMDANVNGYALTSRVIIGTPEHPTTGFLRNVETGIAQKTWYVPERLQADVGASSVAPGVENPLGEAYFKTVGVSPNGTYVHGYAAGKTDLFSNNVRAFSNGCIRIERIHDVMAAALDPVAGANLGYRNNMELMADVGVPGQNNRWANSQLNNARLATVPGLQIAAVHHPVYVRDGHYYVNSSDPYGLYAGYRSTYAFPADYRNAANLYDQPAFPQQPLNAGYFT